jgi:heat shock protein HslJ
MRTTTIMLTLTLLIFAALLVACVPPPPLPPATPQAAAQSAGPTAAPMLSPAVPTARPAQATPQRPAAANATDDLAGTSWTLTTMGGQPPVPNTDVTLNFGTDKTVSGTDGCNNYNTTYTADGSNLTFKQPMATTMKACPDPIMTYAAAYLKVLANTTTYEVSGQQLTLFDAGNQPLAQFAAQNTGLAGTSWQVISYNNGKQAVVSVMAGTTLTAIFGEDGQLIGNAGCNDYNAPYKTSGTQIMIGPAALTRKMCAEPAGVMEQEAAYLSALQTAATYSVNGKSMEMRTAEGALVATFTAQSSTLAGTHWDVLSYNNGKQAVVSVMAATTLTASFGADGQMIGNAGCNDYNAPYKVDGNNIKIGPVASTRKECPTPPGVMEQEQGYLASLETAATYSINGKTLEMRTADNAIAVDFMLK